MNKFPQQIYPLSSILNEDLIINIIDLFWKDYIQPINSDEIAIIIVRLVKDSIHTHSITITPVNFNDKDIFSKEILKSSKPFYDILIDRVEIYYDIKTNLDKDIFFIKNKVNYHSYFHYKLPITMNPLNYGNLVYTHDNIYISQLDTHNLLITQVLDNSNHVALYRKGEKIMT